MSEADRVREWIVHAALAGADEVEVLTGTCEWLSDAGFALVRGWIAGSMLDPSFDARGLRWLRGEGGNEEAFPRTDDDDPSTEDWRRSPFYALIDSGERMLRRRLDATYAKGEFPILDRFQKEGVTDYVAFAVGVGRRLRFGDRDGIVASWTTDAPSGYTDAQVATLTAIMPTLTMAITLGTIHRAARTMITTYLGSDAAERVLAGNIVRGRAEPIRAVVWLSDLIGFTRITDNASAATVLAMLNDYAEAQVEAIEANGGHVLKFIGDGILAMFPHADTAAACAAALRSAATLRERIVSLNARRGAAAVPVTDAYLALHVGELLYGNLGSERRLDFTVLGPAVNEAARIQALCVSLDQKIIVSSLFAEAAGGARSTLVSLGRYAMKGVARPQELFTLDLSEEGAR
jgi:adenylate cyclase